MRKIFRNKELALAMLSQNGAGTPTAIQKLKFSKIDYYLADNIILSRLSSLNGTVKQKTGAVAHSSRLSSFGLEWGSSQAVSWPCALGAETISRVRPDSLRDVLLLPSSSLVYHTHLQASFRGRAGACAPQFRALRVRLRGHAGARSLAAQRAAAAYSGRRPKIVEAGSIAAVD